MTETPNSQPYQTSKSQTKTVYIFIVEGTYLKSCLRIESLRFGQRLQAAIVRVTKNKNKRKKKEFQEEKGLSLLLT